VFILINWLTLSAFEQGLSIAAMRQRLLANNIANVDTPGYKRQDVDFSFYFRQALKGKITNKRHFSTNSFTNKQVGMELQTKGRNDGNNVDIDVEMAKLAQNTLYYQALVRQTSQYLNNLQQVISEGRR
jgi:flagellar basal-body rod protein FlgB